ncbi:MAG TPA: NrsF family protein [Bdellovibrionales bacterium]|nr:NrsF family protein [Bdellovibrionales bacterium]
MKNEALIDSLVKDLKPVKRLPPLWKRILIWGTVATLISGFELFVIAQLRPEAIDMLREHPRFLAETFLIFVTPIFAAVAALVLSVPGNEKRNWLQAAAILSFLAFIGMTVYGLWHPIYEATVYGHRDSCPIDISLFGLVPMAILFYLVRQAAPFRWKWLSLMITLAAFAPLAAVMQLTCMANSLHNLIGHILPIFLMAGLVLWLGKKYLKT